MVDEAPEQVEKLSYRSLLLLQANGFEVDEVELRIWRREEELIRSAMYALRSYARCGLEAAHFAAPLHSLAWDSLLGISKTDPEAMVVEAPTLLSEMRNRDERLGGPRGITWLAAVLSELPVPPEYGLLTLVREVMQHHRLRLWRARSERLSQRLGAETDLAGLQNEYVSLAAQVIVQVQGEAAVDKGLEEIEWDPRNKTSTSLVRTGIDAIDRCGGGGHGRGELLVWGGGTSSGKSYGAQRLLERQAFFGNRALYISCEDPIELMFCRQVADFSSPSVSPRSIRTKTADPEVVEAAVAKMRSTFSGRIKVIEAKKPTISQVLAAIQRFRYASDGDLVIVDYLQAITEDEPTVNKVQEMASVTSKLKRCFTECKVAGVVFSQYARDSYRDGTEPGINSCKYCGDIENEAETMVLFWKDTEGVLHAKLPKAKWTSTSDLRYIVPINSVTGCHGEWQEDFTETGGKDD